MKNWHRASPQVPLLPYNTLIHNQQMKYLITYYYKNDLEQRHQRHDTMQMALAVSNLLLAKGDYVIDSITTEYEVEE